ncbi:MAG: hypothetical protein M3347_17530, partial [Armatimonadota bacterium]|nr:hypothetical protein [Armatimonadota bacterium]
PGSVRLQGNYYRQGDDVEIFGGVAAGRVGERIELSGGVQRLSGAGVFDKTGIVIGGKYLFTRETDPVALRIAAGGGYSNALLKNIHAYVVGTKSLSGVAGIQHNITLHGGVRWDRFEALGFDSDKASVFGGIEIPFTRTGALTFVGELQSKNADGASTPYSAGVRYAIPRGWSGTLGVARQGLNRTGIFLEIGKNFSSGFLGQGQ